MNGTTQPGAVSQKIFQMGLSVETVSVYLLFCGLAEENPNVSLKHLKTVWNGTSSQLTECLRQLEKRKIIKKILSGSEEENAVYQVVDPEKWLCH